MPVQNAEIVAVLERVADLLELQEANPFRVRAYRSAALRIRGLSRAGRVRDIKGFGERSESRTPSRQPNSRRSEGP